MKDIPKTKLKPLKPMIEDFTVNFFLTGNGTESAKLAKYSPRTAYSIACRLLKRVDVQARLKELQDAATSAKILSVTERKEILSEIARAKASDFVTAGADGSYVEVDSDRLNSRAVAHVKTKTVYDDNTNQPSVITDIRLHDPVKALAELNKMEQLYSDNVNIANISFKVVYETSPESPVV